MQKRLNRSSVWFETDSCGSKELCISWGLQSPEGRNTFYKPPRVATRRGDAAFSEITLDTRYRLQKDEILICIVPKQLTATVESHEANADVFPRQSFEYERRTLVRVLLVDIAASAVGRGADRTGDVAGLDYCNGLLLRPTLVSARA